MTRTKPQSHTFGTSTKKPSSHPLPLSNIWSTRFGGGGDIFKQCQLKAVLRHMLILLCFKNKSRSFPERGHISVSSLKCHHYDFIRLTGHPFLMDLRVACFYFVLLNGMFRCWRPNRLIIGNFEVEQLAYYGLYF